MPIRRTAALSAAEATARESSSGIFTPNTCEQGELRLGREGFDPGHDGHLDPLPPTTSYEVEVFGVVEKHLGYDVMRPCRPLFVSNIRCRSASSALRRVFRDNPPRRCRNRSGAGCSTSPKGIRPGSSPLSVPPVHWRGGVRRDADGKHARRVHCRPAEPARCRCPRKFISIRRLRSRRPKTAADQVRDHIDAVPGGDGR